MRREESQQGRPRQEQKGRGRCSSVCGAGVELWSGGLGEDGLRCGWKMIIIGVASAHGFNYGGSGGGGGRGQKMESSSTVPP